MLIAVAVYAGWKISQYFARGKKDHRWIWSDAKRGALQLAAIFAIIIVARLIFGGPDERILFYLVFGLVAIPIPFLAYSGGRFWGIWRRSRQSRLQ